MQLKERLKYNNRKIKAKSHLVSKVCPSKPVGEKGKGEKERKERKERERERKWWSKVGDVNFFFSFKLSKCSTSGKQGRGAKGNQEQVSFLMVGKLGFYVFHV